MYDLFDDQDEEQSKQTSGDSTSPLQSIGSDGGVIGGTSGSNDKGPTHSGAWTNLQSYLDANQDQNFGTKVAGKLQSTVDNANQAVSDADQGFKSQVDQGTTKYDSDLVNSALSDPTNFTQDSSQVAKFNQQRDASYGGPSTLSDNAALYNPAQTAVDQAQQESQASQSEGGRMSLLDKYFGGTGSQYTQGQKNLDNFLVQADPNAQQAFTKANQSTNDLVNNFNSDVSADQDYASKAKGTTEAARNQTRQALGIDDNGNLISGTGAIGTFQDYLNNKVTDAATSQTDTFNRIQNELKSGTISAQDAALLGIDPKAYAAGSTTGQAGIVPGYGAPGAFGAIPPSQVALYGIDPSQFLSQSAAPTAQTIGSSDDYAKMAALAQLAGIENTILPSSDSSQAGTYSANPTFDNSTLEGRVAAAKAQSDLNMQNEINGTQVTVPGYMVSYLPARTPGLTMNKDGSVSMNLNLAKQAYDTYKTSGPTGDANAMATQSNFYNQNILPKINAIAAKYTPNYLKIS